LSIFLNSFFVFCMIFPQQGTERLKQPLKALLGSLVGCNSTVHITILVMVFNNIFLTFGSQIMRWYTPSIVIYIMTASVNSSHWLNVFYCLQIIPVRHPYSIWFKKNLRVFVYCSLTIKIVICCLLGISVNVTSLSSFYSDMTDSLLTFTVAAFWIRLSFFILSLCLMLTSSSLTVVFLRRHMKNMEKSSGSCSSPQRQRQIRVTIMCITIQALLHITCSILVIIEQLILGVSIILFDTNRNILCTVISLYSFGTTINLGLSQGVFRQIVEFYIKSKCM
uniref:Taste receptor type 2 n=1 Tax=Astyanax mexicanus TaxID=7994 RepID=A0A3B1JZE6_ASTMX